MMSKNFVFSILTTIHFPVRHRLPGLPFLMVERVRERTKWQQTKKEDTGGGGKEEVDLDHSCNRRIQVAPSKS